MGSFRDLETKQQGGRFRQAELKERAKRKPTLNPVTNWTRTVTEAGRAFVDSVRADYDRAGERMYDGPKLDRETAANALTLKEARQGGATALSGVNALLSPITGVFEAAVVKPYGALNALVDTAYTEDGRKLTGDAAREQNRARGEDSMRLGLSAVRPSPGFRAPAPRAPSAKPAPEAQAVNAFARRAKVNPAEMRTRATEMRRAGVQPTLVDVAGDRGRRIIRAAGAKTPEAGEALVNRSRTVTASAKPAAMQRTRALSPDPRTSDELVDALFKARDEAARTNYSAAYGTPVRLDEKIVRALSDEPGKAALRRARAAAVARMDDARVAEIDSILSGKAGTVSAATLDRTRIAMRERADTSAVRGARDTASGLRMRQGMIDDALDQVPELGPARADYRAKSQAIDVLGKGRQDVFSTDPTDYQAWLRSLSPEAVEANKVAIRQEIMDTLGGQRSSTFGTLDELATSQYARQNLAAALGPQEAESYLTNITARLDQVRNASMVSPNAGSRTAVLDNDMERLSGLVEAGKTGVQAITGDVRGATARVVGHTMNWLRARGFNDETARLITEAATDEAKLDQIIRYLEAAQPGTGRQFLAFRHKLAQAGRSAPVLLPAQQAPRLLEAPRLATQAAATQPPQQENRR